MTAVLVIGNRVVGSKVVVVEVVLDVASMLVVEVVDVVFGSSRVIGSSVELV